MHKNDSLIYMITHDDLLFALKQNFGFDNFKGEQENIINNLVQGNNTFVLMPTGGGKSLCYQLPAILMDGVAIVISPLIALMKNQVDAMRQFAEKDNVAHFINSSLSRQEITAVKKDISKGKTKLLYVAPESLTKAENVNFLKDVKISFYAIDEAHCISEWGHDFRPEYRNIRPIIDKIGQSSPVIALTATATEKVQHDILKNLCITDAQVFRSSFNRPNLYYEVRQKTDNVDKELIRYIRQMDGKSGIVYCLARKEVEDLAQTLRINGISALPYHAGMDAAMRAENQDAFLMEKVQVIVATIAFGMGIDKPDVRFVVHYDIPKSIEGYYQETGRAGRDGGEGQCICFYSQKDIERLRMLQRQKSASEVEIGNQLLFETQTYAESNVCRRKLLLHYFSEEYPHENCGNCDNCKKTYRTINAQELLEMVLETIIQVKEQFKVDHIVDLLKGKRTSAVISYHHDELDNFGAAEEEEETTLYAVVRQAMLNGLIIKDIESYGDLKITPDGKRYLKHPTSFEVPIETHDNEEEEVLDMGIASSAAADNVLFSILKDVRKKLSKQLDVPPFVIFQDPSLEAMATNYPITIEELQNIPGVGQGKAKRYGNEFLHVIKEYVEENEIIRPEDLRVRTVAKDSTRKISIIQAIDRRVALDDLAESKGMSFEEMLQEIEAIVYSGTKLNINYFIEEVIDADEEEDIYNYFKNAESDNIQLAMEELGEDDYDEKHVRLVRIKFHSELGN